MSNAFDTLRYPRPAPSPLPDDVDIEIIGDNPGDVAFDEKTGTVRIEHADGGISIDVAPDTVDDDSDHDANLAETLPSETLGRIADDLLRGIELDDTSRHDWLEATSKGIDLLGLQIKSPATSQLGGAQLEGTSKVVHPLLKEAVLRFQANARGELLPADGPVKVRDDAESGGDDRDMLRQALQDDLNHYLTTTDTAYYPDTDRLLLFTGFRGCGFKKVYRCPIRRRPVSESVEAENLIVSNAATDLKSCSRVTHRIMMRPSTLKRMQLLGAYRKTTLTSPMVTQGNVVDQKKMEVQGTAPQSYYDPQDRDREVYECYCEIEVPGHEHKENGEETGLPLPWKVTIDKDSREVLEVRRNWDEDDDQCMALTVFVKYPFVPGFGFYDIGLLQILGDTALAATAGWREMLDAGAFSCFPGFLYLKALAKQLTNEFRVPPGGGVPIDGAGLSDIRQAVMPLPYQPPNQAMMALIQDVVQTAQRVGGTADLPVGEGRQDAPVGTTLALIEQATKVVDAVHKRLHAAQSQEFQLLKDRFMEDPEALWRHNKKSKVRKLLQMQDTSDPSIVANQQNNEQIERNRQAKFIAALADYALVPAADPNTSSQMARIMKAVAVKQLQTANPQLYDARAVDSRILRSIGWTDVDSLFNNSPPPPAPTDPKVMAAAAAAQAQSKAADAKMLDAQTRARQATLDNVTELQKIQSEKTIATINLAREQVIHQNDAQQAAQQMALDASTADKDRQADLLKHASGMHADAGAANSAQHVDMLKHVMSLHADAQQAAQQAAEKRGGRVL